MYASLGYSVRSSMLPLFDAHRRAGLMILGRGQGEATQRLMIATESSVTDTSATSGIEYDKPARLPLKGK